MNFLRNILLNTDSYKASHFLQYPAGTSGMFSYIESRGGEYDKTLFFGLQIILKEYLAQPVTLAMVDEAAEFFAAHGEPFDAEGWRYIVSKYQGFLPVRIAAVPEGTLVEGRNILCAIECTDARVFWCASYIESILLRVWYPITVATRSWSIKQLICKYLEQTSDSPAEQLAFKLHDFGARGVSSAESAAIGGCAHLVNFMGSDTVVGVMAAREFYGETMAGYSIPAAEHSTITSWLRENEAEAYRNMIKQFGGPGKIFAVVSDSYNIFNACEHIWGRELKQEVLASGATLVIRPDSGEPAEIVLRVARILERRFGVTHNTKGYKVLNKVRIIQGDGINEDSIKQILEALTADNFATDNIAFGMGGVLLQALNRDTLQFAMKCSAILINGEWRDVYKEPLTDPGKVSKKGRLTLIQNHDTSEFMTIRKTTGSIGDGQGIPPGWQECLLPVWDTGKLLKDWRFDEIRCRANAPGSSGDRRMQKSAK